MDVCFLLENQLADAGERGSFLFERPLRRIRVLGSVVSPAGGEAAFGSRSLRQELEEALCEVERERRQGRFLCGYLAYEAGQFLEHGLTARPAGARAARVPASTPANGGGLALLDFYSFDSATRLTSAEVAHWLERGARHGRPSAIYDVLWTETPETYRAKLGTIREHIKRGDTYQVNFTFKCRFRVEGEALSLYSRLRSRQRVEFGAYLRLPDREILSFSPELFVRKQGAELTFKPMKGTAPRADSAADDSLQISRLRSDPKARAENVMIVDLLRNDLGRVAEIGSIRVDGLFEVETFETVHQMVSTVRGRVSSDTTAGEVLRHVFPCGSVTGAPKVRTMEIIGQLENEPRGVYTGALGFITPQNDFCFSVPIRTLTVDGGVGEMGVGSGIIDGSEVSDELEECRVKAEFLTSSNAWFRLIETFRFESVARSAVRIEAHLDRMRSSAKSFNFAFDEGRVRRAIDEATAGCAFEVQRVRVTLSQAGDVTVEVEPLSPEGPPASPEKVGGRRAPPEMRRIAVSEKRIDSRSCFQHHKTTARALYDAEYGAARSRDAYDVVFLNERGEVAEASRHNIFVEKDGLLVTPPSRAGALAGIERQRLLDDPRREAVEGMLTLDDLRKAKTILLTNSVRGVVEVCLERCPQFGVRGVAGDAHSLAQNDCHHR